jgi:RecB family exonuclease
MLPRGDDASHAAIAAVVDEWRRYGEVVASAGGGASLDEFRATYLGEPVHRRTAPGRVALLSPREATGRSFAAVFVCGCAEGFFPAGVVRDGYISMAALARALEKVDADAAADLAARVDEAAVARAENALFLTALTRAHDTLTMLSPAKIGGESTLPARVLDADARPFRKEPGGRLTSPCARAAAAVAAAPATAALAAKLRPLDALAGWWVSPPAPERWPALASFSMSASKLNSYARCPRQFFYRKVLKLDEPESIYLRVGSLVHDALKEIIPVGSTGDEVRAALRGAGTREIAERLVSKEMQDAGAWMKALSVRYLEDMLASVVKLESEREGDYRVRMLEEPIDADIGGMPLSGRMDRVDDAEGVGPVIIDYKTSGSIKKMHTTVIDKLETDYWQVPVYAAMAADNGLEPAGFVYYALPPGDESFAVGVQLAPGRRPAPIPLGTRRPYRYGPIPTDAVAAAMARAVEIYRSIMEGECRYERTENTGTCSNCHFARICQRSRASL